MSEPSNLELENKIKFLYSIRGDVQMRQKIPVLVVESATVF